MLCQADLACTADVLEVALECLVDLLDCAQEVRIPLILQKACSLMSSFIRCTALREPVSGLVIVNVMLVLP